MISSTSLENCRTVSNGKVADLYYDADTKTAIIVTKAEYLPMDLFRELFAATTTLLQSSPVQKLIFDKRSMKIFHQPSMEWYYNEWKTAMYTRYGLRNHFKLLPNDQLFRKSVEIGRTKIINGAAEGSPLKQLNIRYFESLEEAMEA